MSKSLTKECNNMMEVELTHAERNHPAATGGDWIGPPAKFWRLPGGFIENITKKQRETLVAALDEFVDILTSHYGREVKNLVMDYEVCGSHAFGTQRVDSDIDIQLSTGNQRKQERLEELILSDFDFFRDQRIEVSQRLKMNVDVGFSEWRNKGYNTCYSLKEKKLYGRKKHDRFDPSFRRYWNKDERTYKEKRRVEPMIFETEIWNVHGDMTENGNRMKGDA